MHRCVGAGMQEKTYVELLTQARDSLNAYLFDEIEPPYDGVMELCKKIDALLPELDSSATAN